MSVDEDISDATVSYLELSSDALLTQQRHLLVDTWLGGSDAINCSVVRTPEATQGRTRRYGCETCAECATFEFQPENIAPLYSSRDHFVKPQWKMPWSVYLAYRVIIAVLLTTWILADFLAEAGQYYSDNYAVWFIYATNWNFSLMGFVSVYHMILVIRAFHQHRRGVESHPEPCASESQGIDIATMIFWILYNCAANGAMVVTMSYWVFLVAFDQAGFLINAMSRLKHTLNTIYIIVDLMISSTPIRIFHVIYSLFWGAIYTVFNVVYFTNNGLGPNGKPYAYYVMDWRNPLESALTCSIGFILSTILQCALYGLYRLRIFIYGSVMHVRYDVISLDHGDLLEDQSNVGSDSEIDNIIGPNFNRAASYSSTDTAEHSLSGEVPLPTLGNHSNGHVFVDKVNESIH